MKNRSPMFSRGQCDWIRQWRVAFRRPKERPPSLSGDLRVLGPGDRARLRRTASGLALACDPAVHRLIVGLLERREKNRHPDDSADGYYRMGVVAGVLVNVNDDRVQSESGTLARRLGRVQDGTPAMSEFRFRQMQATTNAEDLLRLWRRAVALAKGNVDVATLADDLYTWLVEIDSSKVNPVDSVRFHWAYDYYQQPRGKDAGEETPTDAEAVS